MTKAKAKTKAKGSGRKAQDPDSPLNERMRLFAAEYLIDLNATQAAIRAGYSEKGAHVTGSRLLRHTKVAALISEGKEARAARTRITQDRVLEELAKIGMANMSDVANWGMREILIGYDDEGRKLARQDVADAVMVQTEYAPFVDVLDRDTLPEEIRAAVSMVKLGPNGIEIKLHDKVAALTKIGDHLGMFKSKVVHMDGDSEEVELDDHTAAARLAALLDAARQRRDKE